MSHILLQASLQAGASRRLARSVLLCACLLGLSACQAPSGQSAPQTPRPGATLPAVPPMLQAGHYAIRADLSDIRFLVYRAGLLAPLGHNHVVMPATVTGEVNLASEVSQSDFALTIPVGDLRVDDPAARAVQGEEFARMPDAEAIAGTTANMLGARVLDAAHYPQIDIRSVRVTGPASAPAVTVRIVLHGVQREMVVPLDIDYQPGRITVTGAFEVSQTDFGITPMSVLGGAIQVADTVRVRMRLVAVRG